MNISSYSGQISDGEAEAEMLPVVPIQWYVIL